MTSLLTNGIQSALLLYREQYGSEICGEQMFTWTSTQKKDGTQDKAAVIDTKQRIL